MLFWCLNLCSRSLSVKTFLWYCYYAELVLTVCEESHTFLRSLRILDTRLELLLSISSNVTVHQHVVKGGFIFRVNE